MPRIATDTTSKASIGPHARPLLKLRKELSRLPQAPHWLSQKFCVSLRFPYFMHSRISWLQQFKGSLINGRYMVTNCYYSHLVEHTG